MSAHRNFAGIIALSGWQTGILFAVAGVAGFWLSTHAPTNTSAAHTEFERRHLQPPIHRRDRVLCPRFGMVEDVAAFGICAGELAHIRRWRREFDRLTLGR